MKKSRVTYAAQLEMVVMKEGDAFIAYFPALDISTCGDTFEEAVRRGHELPDIFFEETMKHGTLPQALEELGWKPGRVRGARPQWNPPRVVGHFTQNVAVPVPA